jgi:hypothetical protein
MLARSGIPAYASQIERRGLQRSRRGLLPPLFLLVAVAGLLLLRRELPDLRSARVAIYGLPVAFGVVLLAQLAVGARRYVRPVHSYYFGPLLLLYVALLGSSLLGFTATGVPARFLEESLFILSPLLTAGLFFAFLPAHARASSVDHTLAALFTGLYLLTTGSALSALGDVFRWDVFLSSSVATESALAFPLGLLVVYFVARRNFVLAAMTGLCLLLSYKRIAFAATVIALVVLWLVPASALSRRRFRQGVVATAIVANMLLAAAVIQFGRGSFDRTIYNTFQMPSDQLTMGRRSTHNQVLVGLDVPRDILDLLVAPPQGLGSTSEYMVRRGIERNPDARGGNLHSDLLKGVIEFGLLGFIAWIFVFYRLHSLSPTALALAVYWNVLWLTDNSLIYFDPAFVFYVLVGLSLLDQRSVSPLSRSPRGVPPRG